MTRRAAELKSISNTRRRQRVIGQMRAHLLRRGLPRFEMAVIVLGTGLVGFAASAGLLALGLTSMAVRYPAAVLAAYAAFLIFLHLWIEYHRRRFKPDVDIPEVFPEGWPSEKGVPNIGPPSGGGAFGGAGASGTWDAPATHTSLSESPASTTLGDTPLESMADSSTSLLDADELSVIVIPVALIAAGLIGAFAVIYAAPTLMAEVALDALLVSSLYRRLRHLEPQSWLHTAVRHTWLPVIVVVLFVAAAGFLIQQLVPQAVSIGEVWKSNSP